MPLSPRIRTEGILRRHACDHLKQLADGGAFAHNARIAGAQALRQQGVLGLEALQFANALERRGAQRGDSAQSVAVIGKIGGLLGREPGGQHPGDGAVDIQRQRHHECRRIGHSAFVACARDDFREVHGTGDAAGGGAEIIRIAAQQHGAATRRNDFADEPDKVAFERGPMAAALRHGDGAEKEQE